MVKFLYWSSVKPRRHLMGLPLPWLQPSSPRCCLSRPHSQLTDVTVQLKRYNQFHPTRASNWVSVMSIVTEPALIYTACTQSFIGTKQPVKGHLYPKVFSLDVNQRQYSHNVLVNTGIILPNCSSIVNLHPAINLWKCKRILSTANINVRLKCKLRPESFKPSLKGADGTAPRWCPITHPAFYDFKILPVSYKQSQLCINSQMNILGS